MIVTFARRSDGFHILRDGEPMHTPQKRLFIVPSEPLAAAICDEWRGRERYHIKTMPYTSLTFTAWDVTEPHHAKIVEAMLAYADTDLLLYRSETPALQERQAQQWDPILEWATTRYEIRLTPTVGIMPITLSEHTTTTLRNAVACQDTFALTAFTVFTQTYGSLLLALAVRENRLTPEEAFALSRVDENYQAERWGEDSLALGRAKEAEREVITAEKFINTLNNKDIL